MRFKFSYNKKNVLQALRFHFIWQSEIRILLIVIVAFDVLSAILYFTNIIRPEPFLLGSAIWLLFIISFWYILPNSIYKKSRTFKESFTLSVQEDYLILESSEGYVEWKWNQFLKYAETPAFFHLYFSTKSFFLLPKYAITSEEQSELRSIFKEKIQTTVKR